MRRPGRIDTGRVILRFISLLLASAFWCGQSAAQSTNQFSARPPAPAKTVEIEQPATLTAAPAPTINSGERLAATSSTETTLPATESGASSTPPTPTQFRIERLPMIGGAELLTIFGRLDGVRTNGSAPEVPLVSVVRDTLSDNDPENDRLRYVWMLTYTQPTMLKRIASAIPFFYQHVGSKRQASSGPPAPILDLSNISRQTWNRFFWMGLQKVFLDSYGLPLKAASRSYRQNAADYRTAHVTQALSILGNYENLRQRLRDESELLAFRQDAATNQKTARDEGLNDTMTPLLPELSPAFTPGEMLELRARLLLSGNTFGGFLGPDKFNYIVENRSAASVDTIGHNWEMLRQRAEAEGLYFQPLNMPDGRPSHVLLWVSKSDLTTQAGRSFTKRFLNIANPWSDLRLRNWNGYAQTQYFDSDNRPTTADNHEARRFEMIPLALYGL
ncbi:MAG: hypothetical protein QOH42_2605, partial [Blastocatellia bacterium]|nr:hypothetical protein [Blastocatellia bacterium]